MINHAGHPHPSTPAARALCRANGGTGDISKKGTDAPKAKKVAATNKTPRVIQDAATGKPISRDAAAAIMFGKPVVKAPAKKDSPPKRNPGLTEARIPVAKVKTQGDTKVTGATVKAAQKAGIGKRLDLDAADQARIQTRKDEQQARLDRIKARSAGGVAPSGKPGPAVAEFSKSRVRGVGSPEMRERTKRVAAVQDAFVSGRITTDILGVTDKGFDNRQGSNAYFVSTYRKIHIHPDLEKKKDIIAKARAVGANVKGGDDPLETTIAHEMGHSFMLGKKLDKDGWAQIGEAARTHLGVSTPLPNVRQLDKAGAEAAVTKWFSRPEVQSAVVSKVSRYASESFDEFLAEVWADRTMNPRPAPHIVAIGDIMQGMINTREGFIR